MTTQFDLMGDGYALSLQEYPHIRSEEREALFAHARIEEGMEVLDFAAGSGFLTLPLAKHVGHTGRVTAVDVSAVMLEHLKTTVRTEGPDRVDALRTDDPTLSELSGCSFDRCVSLGGYHHVEHQVAVCRSLYRLLKAGGRAVVMDFEDGTPAQRHFDTLVHEHNPTGHHALFLSLSRAVNLARFAGCTTFETIRQSFGWRFDSADAMGRFFRIHHGLDISDAEARDKALENFEPPSAADGSVELRMDYITLILDKPSSDS